MQRYFGNVIEKQVVLSEEDVRRLTKVMRARQGEKIEVVSDEQVFLAQITSLRPLKIIVLERIKEDNELRNKVILITSVLKGEKMDLVLQKATELGVFEIVILQTERCVAKIRRDDVAFKLQRFQKILKEAAEQSKRRRIPNLYRVLDFSQLKEVKADIKMIAYEESKGKTKSFFTKLKEIENEKQVVAVLIGPEGGFSEKEVKKANDRGYSKISLGRRILRAETASLYALSVISSFLERK